MANFGQQRFLHSTGKKLWLQNIFALIGNVKSWLSVDLANVSKFYFKSFSLSIIVSCGNVSCLLETMCEILVYQHSIFSCIGHQEGPNFWSLKNNNDSKGFLISETKNHETKSVLLLFIKMKNK